MKTRYDAALELGFEESDNSPGLLWWFVGGDDDFKIFLDFRTKDDDGDYDGFREDMPPRVYAAAEDDDGDTVWINDSGDTKQRWREEVKTHWTVEEVEERAGLDNEDRGQTSIDWFGSDGMEQAECNRCGEQYPMADLEEGLCIEEGTEQCYYDEYPSELIRKAKRRKEELRDSR